MEQEIRDLIEWMREIQAEMRLVMGAVWMGDGV